MVVGTPINCIQLSDSGRQMGNFLVWPDALDRGNFARCFLDRASTSPFIQKEIMPFSVIITLFSSAFPLALTGRQRSRVPSLKLQKQRKQGRFVTSDTCHLHVPHLTLCLRIHVLGPQLRVNPPHAASRSLRECHYTIENFDSDTHFTTEHLQLELAFTFGTLVLTHACPNNMSSG